MKIVIKATQLDLTPPLKIYIERRLAPLERLVRSFEKAGELMLNVEVARATRHHKKGDVFYVELTMRVPQKTMRLEQNSPDVRIAIDKAKDRLKSELQRFKGKMQRKRMRGR
jgi:putative sigma-54 modulation protein